MSSSCYVRLMCAWAITRELPYYSLGAQQSIQLNLLLLVMHGEVVSCSFLPL